MPLLNVPWVRVGGSILVVLAVLLFATKMNNALTRAEKAEQRATVAEQQVQTEKAEKQILTTMVKNQTEHLRRMEVVYQGIATRMDTATRSSNQRWKVTDRAIASLTSSAVGLINAPAAAPEDQCEVAARKLKEWKGFEFAPHN